MSSACHLNNDKHSGGILDNLGSILGGGGVDEDVLTDIKQTLSFLLTDSQMIISFLKHFENHINSIKLGFKCRHTFFQNIFDSHVTN